MNKESILADHFERLRELLPDVYARSLNDEADHSTRLYDLLKKSMSIVEAVYLQHKETFQPSKLEAYGKIVRELNRLGYSYVGNEELVQKAAQHLIQAEKKPMVKAGNKSSDETSRKAV